MSEPRLSRRDFLKLAGAGVVGGLLGKFLNFNSKFIQSQPLVQASAQTLGSWSIGTNTSIPPIHTALLRNGKIMYLAGSGYSHITQYGPFKAALFDPNTNSETIFVQSEDLFCCGFSQLPNGNILIAGGTKDYDNVAGDGKWHGLNASYEYDVDSNNFYKVHSMAHGRWYPNMGTLPSGKVFVMTGYDEYGILNSLTEVYDPIFKSFSIKYDPTSSIQYCVGSGSSLPGAGTPCYGGTNHGVNTSVSVYARSIVMPSGLVLIAGQLQPMNLWDPVTGKWTSIGNMKATERTYGTAVLLPLNNTTSERGRVLLAGGQPASGTVALKTAELVDFNAGTNLNPTINYTSSMTYGRMYVLPIILPTGQVIIFGGTSDVNVTPVYQPEMFNPTNNTWTVLPSASVPRQYHSVAILLPDGRVWTESGTTNLVYFEPRIEIFSPCYLFAGSRPTISDTPTVGTYGGTITIPTPDAASITSVSLLRLGNTTHHFDFENRLIWLQIQSTTSSSVVVSAPINSNIAPPGYYLIHVLNSSGIPSAGKIIHIDVASVGGPDSTPPTIGIFAPSARAIIFGPPSGVPVNVQGTASDSQSGVQSVMVSIDSGATSAASPRAPGDWSNWSFSAFIKTMGPHTIEAVATDNAGNKSSIKVPITISF